LQEGAQQRLQPPSDPLASAVSNILQAGAGVLSTLTGGGASSSSSGGGSGEDGSAFRVPPLVVGVVGSSPKSFPLQMRHSGK
jgi:hypothetical protein